MKTISGKQVFLLLICAAVLAYSMVQIGGVGDHLQYLIPAPALSQPAAQGESAKPNQAVLDLDRGLREAADEWADTMQRWTLDGEIAQTGFAAVGGSSMTASGRLTLLGRAGQELHPPLLRFGRLLYPEELERGDRVMLLDEQLALALFRVGDPIDREVSVSGVVYRVVGVVRHTRRVGDAVDCGACIPLMSVIDESIQLDILRVEAAPVSGVGAGVSFRTVTEGWQPGGTMIDLGRESVGAWLWLRVLGFAAGMIVLLRLIRWLNAAVARFAGTWRMRLQHTYAVRLLPWIAGRCLLLVIGYALCAGAAALLMEFMLAPVYVFPEWIPAVLVEWSDINDAFWKVWQGFAAMRELRSPELIRLRFFTLLVDGFSALAGVVLAMIYARMAGSGTRVEKSLRALYRQGVCVTSVRTADRLAFERLGYAACAGAWQQGRRTLTPMLRIVDAEAVLRSLPASPLDGSFVVEVTDEQIPENNRRWEIVCRGGTTELREARRDWDLRLPVQVLTAIVYGRDSFQDFTQSRVGFEMRMRSPAMDGLFGHHLSTETYTE